MDTVVWEDMLVVPRVSADLMPVVMSAEMRQEARYREGRRGRGRGGRENEGKGRKERKRKRMRRGRGGIEKEGG